MDQRTARSDAEVAPEYLRTAPAPIVKSRPNGRATPILLMSAVYNDHDQSSRTIQLGTLADGYLSKPFDLVNLLAQVRQLLGEAA